MRRFFASYVSPLLAVTGAGTACLVLRSCHGLVRAARIRHRGDVVMMLRGNRASLGKQYASTRPSSYPNHRDRGETPYPLSSVSITPAER